MLDKGVVLKVKQDYAIILTEKNDYLRIKMKDNLKVGQKILFTSDDVLQINNRWRGQRTMSKKVMGMAASLALVLLLGGIFVFNGYLGEVTTPEVATIVTIDINPSVKLLLSAENEVIEVEAMNEDAQTLDLNILIGQSAENAVEEVVTQAKEAGFINEEDLEEDYVLITTISMDEEADPSEQDAEELEESEVIADQEENEKTEENEELEELQEIIENKIQESEELQNVNVAIIKATKVELLEAEGKKVPVGLLVVNGKIEVDGEIVSVREFFANEQGKKAFEKQGAIIEKKREKQIQLAEKFIGKLEQAGVDVSDLSAQLDKHEMDIETLLRQVKDEWEAVEESEEVEDEEIDEEELDEEEDIDEDGDIEDSEEDDVADNNQKAEQKEEKKQERVEEKAKEKAEQKDDKAEEKQERAAEKAEGKQEKAEEKSHKKGNNSNNDEDESDHSDSDDDDDE